MLKTIFYAVVEAITESITGIENGNMKLWELPTYLNVSEDVTILVNIVSIIVLLCVLYVVVDGLFTGYEYISNRFFSSSEGA